MNNQLSPCAPGALRAILKRGEFVTDMLGRARTMGFSLAIWPAVLMQSACAAMESALAYLAANGTTAGSPVPSYDMRQLHDLVGFEDVWAFEQRWAQ